MKPKLNINESFICKIWEGGSAYYSALQSADGKDVEIISYGKRNYDAGPDYTGAKIKIDGKTLTGDIEIHRDFKNWAEHNHQKDRKYNSVILHVVLWDAEDREEPKLRIKRELPTVILSNYLNDSIHNIWQDVINKPSDKLMLPCYHLNESITETELMDWMDRLSIERLNIKKERIKARLNELTGLSANHKAAWEQLLYEYIFEALGFSKNKEQMLRLASNLSLERIASLQKQNNSHIYLQVLLFGASGFLFDVRTKDEYIDIVKQYWNSIEEDLTIPKMNRYEWNFFRMRPQNFPTIRLAYGAQVIKKLIYGELFRKIIEVFSNDAFDIKKAYKELSTLLQPERDEYWESHYDFCKSSTSPHKLIGKQRIEDIIINVIIPAVSLYGDEFNDVTIAANISMLYNGMNIKPDNSVIRLIQEQVIRGKSFKVNTPACEQATIQLYNFYCMRERCGECGIGQKLFSDKGYEYKIIFY